MFVRDMMTESPACCTPETPLNEVARAMAEHNCGCIPVMESSRSHRLVGVVTDRDIVCRTLARDLDPMDMEARDCMSKPVVTTTAETSEEECCQLMEKHQIRRIPVVDGQGNCRGIISQADIALQTSDSETGEVVREVSRPRKERL